MPADKAMVMLNLVEVQYTSENAQPRMRPNPDVANFVKKEEIVALGDNS